MPRTPSSFWRRRRGHCFPCNREAYHAVEYRADAAAVWHCTRCGGVTVLGHNTERGEPRTARDLYLAVPQWSTARKQAWRRWIRRACAGDLDGERLGSPS